MTQLQPDRSISDYLCVKDQNIGDKDHKLGQVGGENLDGLRDGLAKISENKNDILANSDFLSEPLLALRVSRGHEIGDGPRTAQPQKFCDESLIRKCIEIDVINNCSDDENNPIEHQDSDYNESSSIENSQSYHAVIRTSKRISEHERHLSVNKFNLKPESPLVPKRTITLNSRRLNKHPNIVLKGPDHDDNNFLIKNRTDKNFTEHNQHHNNSLKGPCHENDSDCKIESSHSTKNELKSHEDISDTNKKSELEIVFDKIKRSKSIKLALQISPKKSEILRNINKHDSPKPLRSIKYTIDAEKNS